MPFYLRKTQEASPAHKYVADSDLRYSVVDKLFPAQSRDLQTCHQLEVAAAGPAGPLSGPASLPRTPLPVTSRPLVIQERHNMRCLLAITATLAACGAALPSTTGDHPQSEMAPLGELCHLSVYHFAQELYQ